MAVALFYIILDDSEVEGLEIFVERGGAVEDLVTAGLDRELVDHLVVVFEGLAVEGDGGLLRLTGGEGELLEALQRLDGSACIVERLDIDLVRLHRRGP